MAHNPQVQVDLSFEDRYTDLVANGIDVALRLGKLADSSLGARTLGVNPWVLGASPTYLRKRGTPRRPSDLKEHATLIYSSVQGSDIWRLRNASGEPVSVAVTGRLRSNNLSALLAASRSHMGIAALPRYVASPGARMALASGRSSTARRVAVMRWVPAYMRRVWSTAPSADPPGWSPDQLSWPMAVILPSCPAAMRTRWMVAGRCVVLLAISGRCSATLTGRPAARAPNAASSASARRNSLPPKPPPMNGETRRTLDRKSTR